MSIHPGSAELTGCAPPVRFEGNLAVLDFRPPYTLEAYERFLDVKGLPESQVQFLEETQTYRVTTPARFAHLLGVEAPLRSASCGILPPASHLWDYQRHGTEEALDARRYALFWDCGTGKTGPIWEFAFQVAVGRTGGRVLIITLGEVVDELLRMVVGWYGDPLPCPVRKISTRAELVRWCRGDFGEGPEVGITNVDKMIPGVINEFRHLSGLVLDESSILKTGGGTIKWNMIKSARGVEYILSATATPAPNQAMEYASQAAFLQRMRSEGEVIWTYFSKDREGEWYIKPHARDAFRRWLATWSFYLRDPSLYGFKDNVQRVPEPIYLPHQVPATGAQRALAEQLGCMGTGGDLFGTPKSLGVVERQRACEAARGFLFRGKTERGGWDAVDSLKPLWVSDLVRQEAATGAQIIVWCDFNPEVEILGGLLSGSGIESAVIGGDTPKQRRTEIVRAFQRGDVQVLTSKDSLIGFGLNLQMASVHVGSPTDSAERFYQRTKRSVRYGQKERVRVHLPYVPELEGPVYQNMTWKLSEMETDAVEQQKFYAAEMRGRIAA